MVIVTDDADRENEGDLVMAASKVTNATVNFMAKHGRGLICAPITEERARQLGLQRMVAHNREMHKTDFTVSVDAARGITTGISAKDRALTIKVLAASGFASRQTLYSPAMSSRCKANRAAYCDAQATRRPPSTSPAWLASIPPPSSAKSSTRTARWPGCPSCSSSRKSTG